MKLSLAILVVCSAVALAAPIISTVNKVSVNFYMVSGPCIGAPRTTKPPNPNPPSLTAIACARNNKTPALCRTRACTVRVICTRRSDAAQESL